MSAETRHRTFKIIKKAFTLLRSGISIGIFLGLFRLLIFSPLFLFQLKSTPLFIAIAMLSLITAQFVIERYPILRGSGVPHVRSFISGKRHVRPLHNGGVKFICIALLNNIGFSIGSAGPSAFLGVCAGDYFFDRKDSDSSLHSIYGGAGLAAFFSAPLSGLFLSIEEFGLKKNIATLLQAIFVILTAWLTSFLLTGRQLGLLRSEVSLNLNLAHISLLCIIALSSTAAGILFKRLLLSSPPLLLSRYKHLFLYFLPLLFLMLARLYPEISGGGIILLKSLIVDNGFAASMILFFVMLKFLFTLSCVVTNIPAGLFMPSLSIGGAIGAFFFVSTQTLMPSPGVSAALFIACGASCFFFSLMKRPLLSLFISAELFGNYGIALVLFPILLAIHMLFKQTQDQPLNDTLYNLID